VNNVLLTGRLTKDAEVLEFHKGGKSALKFTLAVERTYKKASDGKDVDFIPVTYFTEYAFKLAEYLLKGRQISVTGKISVRSFEDKDNKKKYFTDVLADRIDFLDSKKSKAL
jgi:single-strand DNA-binding protein